jgi:hypothetical protein
MSVASLEGGDDGELDFHETFPAVVSEKRPKAHGGTRSERSVERRLLSSGL